VLILLLILFSFQAVLLFLLSGGGFWPPPLSQDLLLGDLCNATCTYCAATFADSEAKTFFHSDWLDESY
jgi:hypothetical protein